MIRVLRGKHLIAAKQEVVEPARVLEKQVCEAFGIERRNFESGILPTRTHAQMLQDYIVRNGEAFFRFYAYQTVTRHQTPHWISNMRDWFNREMPGAELHEIVYSVAARQHIFSFTDNSTLAIPHEILLSR